jgi:hypothetical protein
MAMSNEVPARFGRLIPTRHRPRSFHVELGSDGGGADPLSLALAASGSSVRAAAVAFGPGSPGSCLSEECQRLPAGCMLLT